MTVAFTEEETAWHKTAQFSWVPFVARLLSQGPIRGKSEELPDEVRALNRESIDAVKQILNRAAWRFLARECGWRRRRICVLPDLQLRDARLWNQQTPELRFSHESIKLLISIYNATRNANRIEKADMPGCLALNGDMIIHHLVFRRLYNNRKLAAISSDYNWSTWTEKNPLSACTAFAICEKSKYVGLNWFFESDLNAFTPWLLNYVADEWLRWEEDRWQGPSSIRSGYQTQQQLCEKLIEAARQAERQDLLIPILEYYSKILDDREEHFHRFESQTQRLSMNERRKIGASWSDFLALTNPLERIRDNALGVHPVERSGPEKLYLSAWEEIDFSVALTAAGELQQKLTPRLS